VGSDEVLAAVQPTMSPKMNTGLLKPFIAEEARWIQCLFLPKVLEYCGGIGEGDSSGIFKFRYL